MTLEQPVSNSGRRDPAAERVGAALFADANIPVGAAADPVRAELQHGSPFRAAIGAGVGTWLGTAYVPSLLDKAAAYKYTVIPDLPVVRDIPGFRSGLNGTLGTNTFGPNSFLGRALATDGDALKNGLKLAEQNVNRLSAGPLNDLAAGWRNIRLPGNVAGAAESATVLGAEARGAAAGLQGVAAESRLMTGAGRVLSAPGVRAGLSAAAVVGGAMVADRLTSGLGSDDYHFAVPGITAAMLLPEGTSIGTRVAVGAGSVILGKLANGLLPANQHVSDIMAPGFADTALLAGTLALPINPQAKLWAAGGAYTLGRMAHMNTLESLGTAAGIGGVTYMKTHNPYLSLAAGAGSYIGSQLLNVFEPPKM